MAMTAPQPAMSPMRAAGRPSIKVSMSPVQIGVMPWNGNGQTCRSPIRAAGRPFTNVRRAAVTMTPPWLLMSPSLACGLAMSLSRELRKRKSPVAEGCVLGNRA